MKQMDNMPKKAYTKPAIKFVNIDQTDIICTSGGDTPQPYGYDDELD